MAQAQQSFITRSMTKLFKGLARSYVSVKKPTVVVVAGSVGKTSSKLYAAHLIASEKRVSYMDDSYNSGIGLFLSVFRLKVPTNFRSPLAWVGLLARACGQFFARGPEVLILEYGIDHPGEMIGYTTFVQPDYTLLTAITPEHMEYFKTLDTVAAEEIIAANAASKLAVVNGVDINKEHLAQISATHQTYGENVTITELTTSGAKISLSTPSNAYSDVLVQIVAEPLIRQLAGAVTLAEALGISKEAIERTLPTIEPAASRMHLFEGVHNSTLIDDSTNFSPDAGIAAVETLKKMPGTRKIAILGNMHELGDYVEKGFADVAAHFTGLDVIVLVGDLSREHFAPHARKLGFSPDKTLYEFDDSISAGRFVRDHLAQEGDVILTKGPFGGFFLEEAAKRLLRNRTDIPKLTRQSDFWAHEKRKIFGDDFDKD